MRAWGSPQTRPLSSGACFTTQHMSGLATSSQAQFTRRLELSSSLWRWTDSSPPLTSSKVKLKSHSVVSDSATPYSPWSSPGQNTGVGSLSLLPTQGSNPGDLPCPGIKPKSPALQAEPAEPPEKPKEVCPRRFSLGDSYFSQGGSK